MEANMLVKVNGPAKSKWQNLSLTLALFQALSLSPLQAQETTLEPGKAAPRLVNLMKILNDQVTPFALDPQNKTILLALEPASTEDLKGALAILKPTLLTAKGTEAALKAKLIENSEIAKLYFAALLEKYSNNLRASSGYLKQIDSLYDSCQLLDKAPRAVTALERTTLLERQGDLAFRADNSQEAVKLYDQALNLSAQARLEGKLKALLSKETASLAALGEYQQALEKAQMLREETMVSAQETDFHALADSLWAHLQYGDLRRQVSDNQESKESKEEESFTRETQNLLKRTMTARRNLEKNENLPTLEEIKTLYLLKNLRENPPSNLGDLIWQVKEFKLKSLPLISWLPENQKPKAIILCLHGLGLDNRSFSAFGSDFAQRGFQVIALDVRGFGAWLAIPGKEKAAFKATLADVERIAHTLKKENPDLPLFLLGESMGGGLALQAASLKETLFAGVVSSVPSARQYDRRAFSFATARHFLKDPNAPFNIGTKIVNQATSDEKLRQDWQADPKSKLALSPNELLQFQLFMRQTAQQCQNLKETPALVIQGLKDRLVQPEGTIKIFDAITSDKKTLILVGNFEHLIFENEAPNPALLDTVEAWMKTVIEKSSRKESP
jgi:alpha-beta hydrolase superfamily lysophospholipase